MPRPTRVLAALTATAVLGVLPACGADPPPQAVTSEAPTPRSSATPTPEPTAPPEASATSAPTPTPTRKPRPRRGMVPIEPAPHARSARPVAGHLLAPGRVPVLAEDVVWSAPEDRPEGEEPVGACQKTSLFSIGAMHGARRTFAAEDGSTVTQVVARFPDGKSAWRAHQVLLSWQADCGERLSHPRTRVGEVREVPVRLGQASAYVVTYGPKGAGRARTTGFALVRKGSWVSTVEVATAEDRWPRGWNPARQAVRRIAKTFR